MRADWNELRRFRQAVKRRDNYRCRRCHKKVKLQVHHIKKFATFRELRTVVSNGISLCKDCHLQMKGCEETWEYLCKMLIADRKVLGTISQMLHNMKKEEEGADEED